MTQNKQDGRELDHKALESIRIQAMQRVEAGESPEEIIRVSGFNRTVIYEWLAKYGEGGPDALRAKAIPGRPAGAPGWQAAALAGQGDHEQESTAVEIRVCAVDARPAS